MKIILEWFYMLEELRKRERNLEVRGYKEVRTISQRLSFFLLWFMVRTARASMPSAKKKKTSSLIYSMDRENEVSKTLIIKKGKLFFIPTIDRFLSFLLRWLVDKYLLLNFNKKGFIYLFGSVLNEKKLRKIVHHTGLKKMWIYLWDKSAISNSVL